MGRIIFNTIKKRCFGKMIRTATKNDLPVIEKLVDEAKKNERI